MRVIDRWGTAFWHGAYTAPELQGICIVGVVRDPTIAEDDRSIRTSKVVGAKGRIVTTQSGSTYELGEPDPAFLAYLAETGRTYDPENPIKVVKR